MEIMLKTVRNADRVNLERWAIKQWLYARQVLLHFEREAAPDDVLEMQRRIDVYDFRRRRDEFIDPRSYRLKDALGRYFYKKSRIGIDDYL